MLESDKNKDEFLEIARSYLKLEKRKAFWRNFLIFSISAYFVALSSIMVLGFDLPFGSDEQKYVAKVSAAGMIAPESDVSYEKLIPVIERALKDENSLGVIVELNSPGGSPVQSSMIYKEIKRLKTKYKKKVIGVVEDICASGCYYLSMSMDKIYADENSIVGSIGVKTEYFKFQGLMNKLGINRKVISIGDHKVFIDPFGKDDPKGIEHFKSHVLKDTFETFVSVIKENRGDKITDDKVYSGLVWSGKKAFEKGLIDGIATPKEVAMKEFQTENIKSFKIPQGLLRNLLKTSSEELGEQVTSGIVEGIISRMKGY